MNMNNILLFTHDEETGYITDTLLGISMASMVRHYKDIMIDIADSLVGFHENEFIQNQVHLNNILLFTHETTCYMTGTLLDISMACMVRHTRIS